MKFLIKKETIIYFLQSKSMQSLPKIIFTEILLYLPIEYRIHIFLYECFN